jgi:hypothetical protein
LETTPSAAAQTNREALFSMTGVPCLGELSRAATPARDRVWIDEELDIDFLATSLARR